MYSNGGQLKHVEPAMEGELKCNPDRLVSGQYKKIQAEITKAWGS